MMLSVSLTVLWTMIGSLGNSQFEGYGSSCGLIGTHFWCLPGGTVQNWSVSQYFNLRPPKYQAGAPNNSMKCSPD